MQMPPSCVKEGKGMNCSYSVSYPYLSLSFPNTGSSTDHAPGWKSFRAVLKLIDGLKNPKLLIANKYRHRASTLYAMSEIPHDQRAAFSKHMGHTENVNKEVDQCLLAIKEVTPFLISLCLLA